jgi:hypothetical protein
MAARKDMRVEVRGDSGIVMKGQLSAEMLIMVVVVLAVVAIAATQLTGAAKDAGQGISNQSKRISEMATEGMMGEEGEYCIGDDDCRNGECESHRCN